ncbi:MAG: hypothetical protein AAGA26_02750 [Pseudomonadota bacterium]
MGSQIDIDSFGETVVNGDHEAGATQAPIEAKSLPPPSEHSGGGSLKRVRSAIDSHPVLTRWLTGGPGAFIATILIMAVMPLWMPQGAAKIDHIVMPVVLFPLIWCLIFLYTCLEENLSRSVAVIVGLILVHTGFVASAFA